MTEFLWTPAKVLMTLALLVACQSCVFDLDFPSPLSQTERLPAAAYFQWAGTATEDQRQRELTRLQQQVADSPELVSLIQRAIIVYYMDDLEGALVDLNLAGPHASSCRSDRRCRDYGAFAELFGEMAELKRALDRRQADVSALQDRIRVLDQQLEALTNIERQLLEREQRPN